MKRCPAEYVGTLILVLTGTAAIVVNDVSSGVISHLGAIMGGPVSGASMNPARSLGPALISGNFQTVWIYLLAPVVGALLAILCCRCMREACCCRRNA